MKAEELFNRFMEKEGRGRDNISTSSKQEAQELFQRFIGFLGTLKALTREERQELYAMGEGLHVSYTSEE